MSAIAGLVEPVGRRDPGGLLVHLAPANEAELTLQAPIAPGYIRPIGIRSWRRIKAGMPYTPATPAGSIALDGEREISFSEHDRVRIELEENAFRTINVGAAMNYAARHGLLQRAAVPELERSVI